LDILPSLRAVSVLGTIAAGTAF